MYARQPHSRGDRNRIVADLGSGLMEACEFQRLRPSFRGSMRQPRSRPVSRSRPLEKHGIQLGQLLNRVPHKVGPENENMHKEVAAA